MYHFTYLESVSLRSWTHGLVMLRHVEGVFQRHSINRKERGKMFIPLTDSLVNFINLFQ